MCTSQSEALGQAITTLQPRLIGALPILYPIVNGLQVRETTNALVAGEADIDLGRVVILLTLNRLLAPQPLYQVEGWLAETILPEILDIAPEKVYDNRLGRALDRLYPHLGELWACLVSRAIQVYGLNLNVLHWDISSIYFEGAYTDSRLAAYGYSRDHRPDTKQVTLELDVTHEGYVPVLYQVLAGNTADITQPLPHLHALLRFLARPELAERQFRPLLVSDSKLVTPEAVVACHRHRLFYLGPLPNSSATAALLGSVSTTDLVAHPLAYRPERVKADDPRFIPYQGVWCPCCFAAVGQEVTDRALVVWSAGKQRLDEQKRKTHLKRLLDGLAHIQNKLNTARYKKRVYVEQRLSAVQQGNPTKDLVDVHLTGEDGALQFSFRVNRPKLAQVQVLDGRYAVVTNAAHLSADETLQFFKGRDGIEKQIGVVKGPLVVHPLFVRTDHRIEGLVFVTLLALLVRALLERACRQRGLAVTADRLLQAFAGLQAVDLTWSDGSRQRRASPLTAFQAQVLSTLGWPEPATYTDRTLLRR